ncbi:hypothetical protein D9613_002951 [Agrocybe pediades]|uniref:Cupredoxin n=1 Tax=Agrocybe pediades TaxID=84607 RepID=A0A8H4VNZ7_9AGAR|nr:hypothetical protein D9613_002951 [Agrocybe pediades]KAF9567563.1 hypothetical protein CPC08DRAFT_733010 [Agrocybe pediades]
MHYRTTFLSTILAFAAQSTLAAKTIDVVVGGPGILQYNPPFVNADVGDRIHFIFKEKNHTVTQSTFDNPCTQSVGGFDSGFHPVASGATVFPEVLLEVPDLDPIWIFCRQANHCQQGMVFSVNPGDKFAAFQAAAKASGGGATSTGGPAASGIITVTTTVTVSGSAVPTTYTTTTSSSATSSSTPSGGIDHKVIVGGPGVLAYNPSNISAQVGDTITFEFHQKNHTVTASSFDTPCHALSSTSTTGQLGFDSGFMAVADGATEFPTFTIRVNDTNPIWAYCRQANHCGSGMVFAANAVESGPKNFTAFQDLAKQQNGTSTNAPPPNSAGVQATTSTMLSVFNILLVVAFSDLMIILS